ncbi:MAG: MmcQ/YjbR family DNA-binding protein [Acidimicrobiales bacterium]|jgi:predicted DNA-binding protein (MmcQ/YjbR family)
MSKVTTRETVLAQCGGLVGTELSYPFGDDTAVFKVGGKMLALVSLDDSPGRVTLKCDPDAAVGLRDSYAAIGPGYHMDKRHWITVELGGDVPDALLADLIVDSYDLVVGALPARLRPPTT